MGGLRCRALFCAHVRVSGGIQARAGDSHRVHVPITSRSQRSGQKDGNGMDGRKEELPPLFTPVSGDDVSSHPSSPCTSHHRQTFLLTFLQPIPTLSLNPFFPDQRAPPHTPAHSPSPRYPPLKETNPDTRKARKKPRSPWRAE